MRLGLILLVLVTIIPCSQIAAQELLDLYDRETMYIHYSIRGDGFVKNGQIMNMGILGGSLAKEMAGSEFALEEMQKFRKYKIAGAITDLVATGFGITGIVLAFRDEGSKNQAFEITSLIASAICGILSNGFNRASIASINRAVWLYNRDVMSGQLEHHN